MITLELTREEDSYPIFFRDEKFVVFPIRAGMTTLGNIDNPYKYQCEVNGVRVLEPYDEVLDLIKEQT